MKFLLLLLSLLLFILLPGCSSADGYDGDYKGSGEYYETGNGKDNNNSGIITAAEWNDLDHWSFWKNLLLDQNYSGKVSYWNFYTNNRISIVLKNIEKQPIINATLLLIKGNKIVWESKTDNLGKAELWIDLFDEKSPNLNEYSLVINGNKIDTSLKLIDEGINEVEINSSLEKLNKVELSFVVDATGSMDDELEFLKSDLKDVIKKIQQNNSNLDIFTSAVFYRDRGEDYITKVSNFSNNMSTTLNFINAQNASGGGDFPEAVEVGISKSLKLNWSKDAKTRIMFLILDPPHHNSNILATLHNSIKTASKKGIKLIPIVASGIDKNTEFLMRFFAISTNGTYVFITDDSGVGDNHLEASVGDYQVENLNALMIRLIKKYTK